MLQDWGWREHSCQRSHPAAGAASTCDINAGALPVFPNNVGGQQLQQLPVLLDHVQLIGISGGRCGHAGEPGLETRRLHASQLGQGAAEMQEARVRALLSWGQIKRRGSVKEGRGREEAQTASQGRGKGPTSFQTLPEESPPLVSIFLL